MRLSVVYCPTPSFGGSSLGGTYIAKLCLADPVSEYLGDFRWVYVIGSMRRGTDSYLTRGLGLRGSWPLVVAIRADLGPSPDLTWDLREASLLPAYITARIPRYLLVPSSKYSLHCHVG